MSSSNRWFLFAVPSMAFLGLLFVAPQIVMALQSLHPNLGMGQVGASWTLRNYVTVLTDPYYVGAFVKTIWISLVSTVACILLGYPVAYFLARTSSRARGFLTLLVISPLLITIVIRSLGWITLLSNTGPINGLLRSLHIVDAAVPFMYNEFGVVLGMVHAFLPMMIVILIGSIQQIQPMLEEAAADLGAGRIAIFWRVIIPLSMSGISAGGILIFAASSSVYTTTVMLGGGRVLTTPVQIARELTMTLNYPIAATLAVVITTITITLAVLGMKMTRIRHIDAI